MEDKAFAILATSSTEAELISAAHCAAEVAFLRKLAEELGFHQVSPTIIYEDNNGCIALGNSGHFKGRSRHIDLRYMFLSDYIARGIVKFERVDSKKTKLLTSAQLQDPGQSSKDIVLSFMVNLKSDLLAGSLYSVLTLFSFFARYVLFYFKRKLP